MNTITREFLRKNNCCYQDKEVAKLVPVKGLTTLELLALEITAADRIWVATLPGVVAPTVLWKWQALFVKRTLNRIKNPDPRSFAIIPILERLGNGEKIPQEELAAAVEAVWSAFEDAYAAWDAGRTSSDAKNAGWIAWWATRAATSPTEDFTRRATRTAARAAARAGTITSYSTADHNNRTAMDAAWNTEENQQIADLINIITQEPT